MALNVEEHTITQSVLALEQPAAWKALETFAEYGGWHEGRVTYDLTRLIADRPGSDLARLSRLGRRRHQGPSLQPARLGDLHLPRVHRPLPQPGRHRPRPQLGRPRRLAPRARASPAGSCRSPAGSTSASRSCRPGPDGTVAFRTKCELAVELLREQARIAAGHKHLGVFDGGYALRSVVRPLVLPEDGVAPDRLPHPVAARRPALRPAPDGAPRGEAGAQAEVGPAAGAAPPRRPVGAGRGGSASPSSTAGSGRSAGRRSCACGGCWDMRCRSRRSSPRSRGTRSGSPW